MNSHHFRFENIAVRFNGRHVIKPSYLGLPRTGVTALFGRNGSGKSTLFDMLVGIRPAPDMVTSVGSCVLHDKLYRYPGLISIQRQRSTLPGTLTIAEAARFFAVEASAILEALPELRPLTRRLNRLSHGQRRLAETMIAVLGKAHMTILDEPFAGLAPLTVQQLIATIRTRSAEKAFLIADHDWPTLYETANLHYRIEDCTIRPVYQLSELNNLDHPDPPPFSIRN